MLVSALRLTVTESANGPTTMAGTIAGNTSASGGSIDLVVTRYREPLQWLQPYLERPGWRCALALPLAAADLRCAVSLPNRCSKNSVMCEK